MQKGFAPILILVGILVIIGVVSGVYYFGKSQSVKPQNSPVSQISQPTSQSTISPSSSPDVAANWKTYTNETLSFRYPTDFMESTPYVSETQSIVQFQYQLTTVLTLSEISVNQKTGKLYASLDEYVRTPRMDISKDIVIDGYPAKRITASIVPSELSGHVIPYEEVALFTPDKSAIVSLYYQKDFYIKPDVDQIFDQILSTFKFTP